ncbi:MAG: SH3 domain-containing protein [Anaerolineales bacterium]
MNLKKHLLKSSLRFSYRRGPLFWPAVFACLGLGIIFLLPVEAQAQGTGGDELDPPFVECCKGNVDQVNLRAGPNASDYEIVGLLVMGQTCKAVGQSKAGLWIQILYASAPGGVAWVNSEFVIMHYGTEDLPIVNPPPTAIPKNQPTIDPTFAAQFSSVLPTRLPTFTPATPAPTITLQPLVTNSSGRGLPPAMIILTLLTIGTFGTILSAMVGRR